MLVLVTHIHIHSRIRARTHTLSFSFSFFLSVRTDGRRSSPSFCRVLSGDCFAAENGYVYYRHLASRQRRHIVRSTRVVNVNAMTVCACVYVSFSAFSPLGPRGRPRYVLRSVSGRTHARTQAGRQAGTHARSSRRRRDAFLV